jgi:hypothetical protein
MPNFVTISGTATSGDVPVVNVPISWFYSAAMGTTNPIGLNLPPAIFETISPKTVRSDKDGKFSLTLPTSSKLASEGIDPPTIQVRSADLGIQHEIVVPDEDADLFDLLVTGQIPSVQVPIYRTATVWRSGVGAPVTGSGRDGDYYLQTSNGDVWKRTSGVWAVIGNIEGPPGPRGDPGQQGEPGIIGPHAATHATGGSDAITPAAIGAAEGNHTHSSISNGSGSVIVDAQGQAAALIEADAPNHKIIFTAGVKSSANPELNDFGLDVKAYRGSLTDGNRQIEIGGRNTTQVLVNANSWQFFGTPAFPDGLQSAYHSDLTLQLRPQGYGPRGFRFFDEQTGSVLGYLTKRGLGINTDTPLAQQHTVNSIASQPAQIIEGASGQSAPLIALRQTSNTGTARTGATIDAQLTNGSDASFGADLAFGTTSGGVTANRMIVAADAAMPASDNGQNLGRSSQRWGQLFAVTANADIFKTSDGTAITTNAPADVGLTAALQLNSSGVRFYFSINRWTCQLSDLFDFVPGTDGVYSLGSPTKRVKTLHLSDTVRVAGNQVLGAQQPAIPDADGTLADLTNKFNILLAEMRASTGHGLIAS